MIPRLRILLVVIAALACAAGSARANQKTTPLHWSPACGTIRFVNQTTCTVRVDLVTNPAGAITSPNVPPGSASLPVVAPGVIDIHGLTSAGGIFYVIASPPGPPPFPVPPTVIYWIPNVTLPPANCCCDVWFDLPSCTCWIVPTSSWGACRP